MSPIGCNSRYTANMLSMAGKEFKSTSQRSTSFRPGKRRREKQYAAGTLTRSEIATVAAASTMLLPNQVMMSSPVNTSM